MLKNKLVQKIIYGLTLALPISLYLFISLALNGVDVNYHIKYEKKTYTVYNLDNGNLFIKDDFGNIDWVDATLTWDTSSSVYGLEIKENEIIRINKDYHIVKLDKETNKLAVREMTKDDKVKTESNSWGLVFIVSIITTGIVVLVIIGKMQMAKKYPVIATLVSLIVGTSILGFINAIVGSMLNVFMIFTGAWAGFTAEYYLFKNIDKEVKRVNKVDNDIEVMRKELEEIKKRAGGLSE